MNEIIQTLSILIGSSSILVGFLLIFLQFYPQRKRNLIQMLYLKMIDLDKDSKKKKQIEEYITDAQKPDEIIFRISISNFNFYVFLYSVLTLVLSLILLIYYNLGNIFPEIAIHIATVLIIIGYLLIIPVAKCSYLKTRYLCGDKKKK